VSNQGDGQGQSQPDDDGQRPSEQSQQGQGQPGNSGSQPPSGQSGGHRLPGQSGAHPQQGNAGGQWGGPQQQDNAGGQWGGAQQQGNTGDQQSWTGGQQSWSPEGGPTQPPSWSTGDTGPNVGPTMNNPQSSYYDRFSAASGEGVVVPPKGGGGGGGRGKVLTGIAAALVVVIAAVAVVTLTRGGGKTPTTAASSSTSSLPPVTATTWVNPTLAAGARALRPGWVSQPGSANTPGEYDVPKSKDWKVESSDMIRGYTNSKGKVIAGMGATSVFDLGYCSTDKQGFIGVVGLRGIGKSDPTTAGATQAQNFADGISSSMDNKHPGKEGQLSAAKQIEVDQGTIPAIQYTITATAGDPDKCEKGKTYEIRTVSFTAQGKSYQLVTVRMLGGPKQLPTSQLEEIIGTFRPGS